MKRVHSFVLLIILGTTCSFAQFERGSVEMTLMGSIGSEKINVTGMQSYPDQSSSLSYAFLNTSIGYYLVDGLSIEPQFGLFAEENVSPSQSILLNLSYTSRIAKSSVALFIRGGYGIGNALSFPLYGNIPIRFRDSWDIHILNGGAGVKFILNPNVALKVEANYRRESYTGSDLS